jgi:hypothetical protein
MGVIKRIPHLTLNLIYTYLVAYYSNSPISVSPPRNDPDRPKIDDVSVHESDHIYRVCSQQRSGESNGQLKTCWGGRRR